jgi:hypothetical protein
MEWSADTAARRSFLRSICALYSTRVCNSFLERYAGTCCTRSDFSFFLLPQVKWKAP